MILGYAGFIPGTQMAGAQNIPNPGVPTLTTLSGAVTGNAWGGEGGGATANLPDTVVLASTTGVIAPFNSSSIMSVLYVDREAMAVTGFNSTTGQVNVIRGYMHTQARAHVSGALVYIAAPFNFLEYDPVGACTQGTPTTTAPWASGVNYLPLISVTSGQLWSCDTGTGQWVVGGYLGSTNLERWYDVGPGQCSVTQASGTGATISPITTAGNIPVVQSLTTGGTAVVTFVCKLNPPSGLGVGHGIVITDVVLDYGNSTGATGTCGAPTLATATSPAPGTSETASSATLVAAGGTLIVTPVVGSCNTAAVTAGQLYSERVTPAVASGGIPLNTDQQSLYFTQAFTGPASAAYTIYVAGLHVHYQQYALDAPSRGQSAN
jgi:hypothetical protein